MMKKKTVRLISCIIAAVLAIAMLLSILPLGFMTAGATEKDDLKNKLASLEDEKASVKQEIADLTKQADDVEATRQALLQEIDLTRAEIETVKNYIDQLQQQIDVKTQELSVAEGKLEVKEQLFADRMREMYEQGDTTYLDILLNSSSISNMLSRIDIITQIMDYDKRVVEEYTAAKEDIKQKRDELQTAQDEQKSYQENLSYKEKELVANEAQQTALQKSIAEYKKEQEAEYDRIAQDMQSVSDKIAEISRREAEEAARKAAEEAARKKAAEEAARRQNASGSSSSSGSSSASVPSQFSGSFVWPVPGYTVPSSAYGWRKHPIYGTRKFHAGEDIPANSGTPIVAAASGTVTTAGWVSGYGNYTVINHGGGVMTAYGHQSSIQVSVGQSVSAGQQIGLVGSTGNSTGPHLHFEVYVNGATQNPMNYF